MGQTVLTHLGKFANADSSQSEVPMGAEGLPSWIARRWGMAFALDDGAAEFTINAISRLQEGGKLGAIEIDVDRESFPSIYVRRQRYLLELLLFGSSDRSYLGGIATVASAHIEFETHYRAEKKEGR